MNTFNDPGHLQPSTQGPGFAPPGPWQHHQEQQAPPQHQPQAQAFEDVQWIREGLEKEELAVRQQQEHEQMQQHQQMQQQQMQQHQQHMTSPQQYVNPNCSPQDIFPQTEGMLIKQELQQEQATPSTHGFENNQMTLRQQQQQQQQIQYQIQQHQQMTSPQQYPHCSPHSYVNPHCSPPNISSQLIGTQIKQEIVDQHSPLPEFDFININSMQGYSNVYTPQNGCQMDPVPYNPGFRGIKMESQGEYDVQSALRMRIEQLENDSILQKEIIENQADRIVELSNTVEVLRAKNAKLGEMYDKLSNNPDAVLKELEILITKNEVNGYSSPSPTAQLPVPDLSLAMAQNSSGALYPQPPQSLSPVNLGHRNRFDTPNLGFPNAANTQSRLNFKPRSFLEARQIWHDFHEKEDHLVGMGMGFDLRDFLFDPALGTYPQPKKMVIAYCLYKKFHVKRSKDEVWGLLGDGQKFWYAFQRNIQLRQIEEMEDGLINAKMKKNGSKNAYSQIITSNTKPLFVKNNSYDPFRRH